MKGKKRKKPDLIIEANGRGMGEKDLSDDSFDDDPPTELIKPLIKEVQKELTDPINDKKGTVPKKAAKKGS